MDKGRKTHTSAEVKNRYNKKVYASVIVRAPKDLVAEFKAKCEEKGISQAQVLKAAMQEFIDAN